MSNGYIMPGDLPESLCQMIRDAETSIRKYIDEVCGGGHCGTGGRDADGIEFGDIDWDHPMAMPEPEHTERCERDINLTADASHAIGVISGVAAALDVTPLTLLASYEDRRPPCVRGMGCLCAGHARGDHYTAKCDTDERPRERKRAKRDSRERRQRIPKL